MHSLSSQSNRENHILNKDKQNKIQSVHKMKFVKHIKIRIAEPLTCVTTGESNPPKIPSNILKFSRGYRFWFNQWICRILFQSKTRRYLCQRSL